MMDAVQPSVYAMDSYTASIMYMQWTAKAHQHSTVIETTTQCEAMQRRTTGAMQY
jgi:hypothetical protein